jgi:hypothetical protein
MPQSDFMSLQPLIKHINNMVNSLNISQKCCGGQGFCRRRRHFPSYPIWVVGIGNFGGHTGGDLGQLGNFIATGSVLSASSQRKISADA